MAFLAIHIICPFSHLSIHTTCGYTSIHTSCLSIQTYNILKTHLHFPYIYSFSEIHEKLSQFSHSLMTSVNGVSSKIKQTEDQSIEKQAELVSRVWEELREQERQWKEERDQREKELQHQLNEFERYLKTNAPQEHINQHDIVLANLEKQCTEFKEMYKVRNSPNRILLSIVSIEISRPI